MTMVYVQRKSDGLYYRTLKNGVCDFSKSGTIATFAPEVAEMWCRHTKVPIRIVGVTNGHTA